MRYKMKRWAMNRLPPEAIITLFSLLLCTVISNRVSIQVAYLKSVTWIALATPVLSISTLSSLLTRDL